MRFRDHCLWSFTPPYDDLEPVGASGDSQGGIPSTYGSAILWRIGWPVHINMCFALSQRAPGVMLVIELPSHDHLTNVRRDVIDAIEMTRPCAVIPAHAEISPGVMRSALVSCDGSLAVEFMDYLEWREIVINHKMRRILKYFVDHSIAVHSIESMSRRLHSSRRAIGRTFQKAHFPPPSRCLQFSRILRTMMRIQSSSESISAAARLSGYPDGFTFSNQMERIVGVRPSEARHLWGWEWLVESWLAREGMVDRPVVS